MDNKIICPICNSNKIKYYTKKNKYLLYHCLNCRLVFVWPIPLNTNYLYDKKYFVKKQNEQSFGYVNYDQDKDSMKNIFKKYIKKLEKIAPQKTIFDVGAATGYFLDIAKKNGWETAGNDISNFASQEARKKGHKVTNSSLSEIIYNKKYGVVTMWDVLEHLTDPNNDIRVINKLLVPNGILAINTIDISSLWARLLGKKWHLIVPPEHLYYYSLLNLKLLLEKNGFKIIHTSKIGKSFSLPYIFITLYNWHKIIIWKKIARYFDKKIWRNFKIPINLRDNIFIIAIKNDKKN